MSEKRYINRPPRMQPTLPKGKMALPAPPEINTNSFQALLQMALPMVTILGTVFVTILTRGTAGRRLLAIIPMLLSVLLSSTFAIYNFRQQKEEQEEAVRDYKQALAAWRRKMHALHRQQADFYHHNYPAPDISLGMAAQANGGSKENEEGTVSGCRLWERRLGDDDFGFLRLGIGSRPSSVTFETPEANKQNYLNREAQRLAEEGEYIHEVPITIPLCPPKGEEDENRPFPHRHALGIITGRPETGYAFTRSLLTHYATFHAPTDAQMIVIGDQQHIDHWRWAFALPHCKTEKKKSSLCFETEVDRLEPEKSKTIAFLKGLRRVLDERQLRLAESRTEQIDLPFILVIIDLLLSPASNSILSELETDPAIAALLGHGRELGAAIFFLLPSPQQVPGDCQAIIQLEETEDNQIRFRYSEVDVNSPRYSGIVDTAPQLQQILALAQHLEPLAIRRSYGADLPLTVGMLDMLRVNNLPELQQHIHQNWVDSKAIQHADWLKVAIGALSGSDMRQLKFSAAADGVHGLVAGSTGSGKSELLMTLILGLAVKYDPTIVNFVLVDFKGGAAFEPFRNLPHCVDIVTNLRGAAVERMFAAIRAELDRRQAINVTTDSKHIVHYRQRGLHHPPYGEKVVLKDKTFETAPYPHLFIIIDEFAEMIAHNPEFKAQLEKITRLGRALGVTLILAAQRPSGVTDQMRANIKFRICLRVETREESNEVLRRPDATYLPSGIPGRGYLQVGNENIELIQVAWTGETYTENGLQENRNVIWLDHADANQTPDVDEQPKLYEVMVSMMAEMAQEHSLPQQKPWPNFLPTSFSLQTSIDMGYFADRYQQLLVDSPEFAEDTRLPLNKYVNAWLAEEAGWPGANWEEEMQAIVGIVDNPYQAEQMPLTVNLRRGHAALFSASGWGKTTFLRSLMVSLATKYSPTALNMYLLDFGGRNLLMFKELPHVGAIITSEEEERVRRLLRWLDVLLEQRKNRLAEAGSRDLYAFNHSHPEAPLPLILVIIDNFAEFRESYEGLIPALVSIVRESRAYGIHFVTTAEQPSVLSGKLYSLMTERFALRLSDAAEYSAIVGRGARHLEEFPGRGFVKVKRRALPFQVALPAGSSEVGYQDEVTKLRQLIQVMAETWQTVEGTRPFPIRTLPSRVSLHHLLSDIRPEGCPIRPLLGVDDMDLQPWSLDLHKMGPHAIVLGPPNSGKTTTLRTLALSLSQQYAPTMVRLVLIDFQCRFHRYGGEESLADLPHVVSVIERYEDMEPFMKNLPQACDDLRAHKGKKAIVILIDNYQTFVEEVANVERARGASLGILAKLAREFGTDGLHFVAAGGADILRSNEALRKQIMMPRLGIALKTAELIQAIGGRPPRGVSELPIGRGVVVKSGQSMMLQIATPVRHDDEIETSLDDWVSQICQQYIDVKASWSSDDG